jgi:ABC-type nitrate/sulfonate/bicarbonate transport system substrate-binding protein
MCTKAFYLQLSANYGVLGISCNMRLTLVILTIIASSPIVHYAGTINASTDEETGGEMTITSDSWLPYAPIFVAKGAGFLDDLHVPVRIILNNDSSYSESTYLNGIADGILEDYGDSVLRNSLSNRSDIQSRVVYVTGYSTAADAIISKENYDISDLLGKTIAFDGTIPSSSLFVQQVLKKHGIPQDAVTLVPVSSENVIESLENGSITAGYVKTTTISDAATKDYKIIAIAEEIPGTITYVLSFRTSVIGERSADIRALIDAFLKGKELLDTNGTKAIEILNKSVGDQYPDIETALKKFHFLNRTENLMAMNKTSEESLHHVGEEIGAIYLQDDRIKNLTNLTRMTRSAYVASR